MLTIEVKPVLGREVVRKYCGTAGVGEKDDGEIQ